MAILPGALLLLMVLLSSLGILNWLFPADRLDPPVSKQLPLKNGIKSEHDL